MGWGVSHSDRWNIHVLITSIQKVDNMTLTLIRDKPFSRSKGGLKTHDIGNIGVYLPRVFCVRSGLNQLYFIHLPRGGKGKYTLVLEIPISLIYTWKWRERRLGLELIEPSQNVDEINGIDQFKSIKIWQNTKQCSLWWIKLDIMEHNLI